ncbi:MAG: DUF4091 domain-containing protein [Phycisphaerae bacterium]|nr:DUF4091 domain-containing protein [Phycisphaerae bacterium]
MTSPTRRHRTGSLALVAVTIAMVSFCAPGIAPAAEPPTLTAVPVTEPPTIDGRLSEPCWQTPSAATDFRLLKTGKPASQHTEARVAYDADTLYVAFTCRDDQMDNLVANETKRDGDVYNDDSVELFLAPHTDPEPYDHFLVNPANTQRDDLGADPSWNAAWKSAVWRGPDRWTVEMAIPLKSLPLTTSSFGPWRINFARNQQSREELSSWAPCQSGFHEPKGFGTLIGVKANLAPMLRRQMGATLTDLARQTAARIQQVPATLDTSLARELRQGFDQLSARLRELAGSLGQADNPDALQKLEADIAAAQARLAALERKMSRVRLADAARSRQGPDAAWAVCQVSSMTKLPADQPFDGMPAATISIALAGRETEPAQIVVVPLDKPLKSLRVSVGRLDRADGGAVILPRDLLLRRVGYVTTSRPSAGAAFPPGRLPDPLLPNQPVDVAADAIQPYWLTVYAPLDTPAGTYRGQLRVVADGHQPQNVPVEARVFGFNLPHRPTLRTAFLLNQAYLAQRHGVVLAENTVAGWTPGLWSGADVQGRANYFGQGEFEQALDEKVKHHGRQSVRITGKKVVRGTHEGPRASYHAGPIRLLGGRSYEFSVWYRTDKLTGLADAWISGGLGGVALKPSDQWKQVKHACAPKEDVDVFVYLRNHSLGSVWFDDAELIEIPSGKNLLPSPGFEISGGKTGSQLLRDYRMSMLAHRICDADVARPDVTVDAAGKVVLDWTQFDREIQSYLNHGLNAFNIKWLQIGGGWGAAATPTDKRARDISAQIIAQTEKHLIEKDWIDLPYIYVFDEPGPDARKQIIDAFDFVHKNGPRLRALLTYGYGATKPWTHTNPDGPEAGYAAYADAVDIHVPHIDCCDWRVLDRLRGKPRKELWHYVCISAKRPYPNIWAIDYTGLDHRIVYWQLWRYALTGTLYWCVNYWKVDVWQDPMSYPGGNGDGSLYYPGKTGPIESIRLELTRDGIDDYDYLRLLADLVANPPKTTSPELIQKAKTLLDVSEICRSFKEYVSDVSVLENRRLALADMIEQLTNPEKSAK